VGTECWGVAMADVGKGNEVLVDIEVGKNSTGKQVLAKSEEAAGKGTEGADPSCCAPGLKLWVPLLAVLFVGGVVAVVCVLLIPGARGSHPPAPPGPQDANFQGTDSAPPPAGVDSGASLPTGKTYGRGRQYPRRCRCAQSQPTCA